MARALLHFLPLFAFIYLAAASACPGSANGKLYWNSVFPNSPMPTSLQVFLQPTEAIKDSKSDSLLNSFEYSTNAYSSKAFKIKDSTSDDLVSSFSLASKSYKIMYFFEQDLHPGKHMKISQLLKTTTETLTCADTNSIPFSSTKFPEILNQFSVQPKSKEALAMKQTIMDCEADAIQGESKFCATSLEGLIDSTISILGKNINLVTSEVNLEKTIVTPFFTINGEGAKNLGGKQVICHKGTYPYPVFLCHSIRGTDVYSVPLVASDGSKAKGLAICHKDTRGWNTMYPAFRQLNVKPGTVSICHFLSADAIVWILK